MGIDRKVDDMPPRTNDPLGETHIFEVSANLVDLLMRLNSGTLPNFRIRQAC